MFFTLEDAKPANVRSRPTEPGFELSLRPQALNLQRTIFVHSMSDRFHDDVPLAHFRRVFDVMRRASWHRFQD